MLVRHISILYAIFELQFYKSYAVSDIKIMLIVFKSSFELEILGGSFPVLIIIEVSLEL